MKIVVGSTNPLKIRAVKNVFSQIYPEKNLEIFGKKVDSKIPAQPFDLETIKGAMNRAKEAIQDVGIDLSVGLEAGLFHFPLTLTGYLDIHWCVILDRKGRATLGCSPGFELPPKVVHQILKEGKEVGGAMDIFLGMRDIGRKMGAIGHLSKGILKRINLNESAIMMAMIPRINEEDYLDILNQK
jgi:inosine/xanthosine triphosphatase